MHMLCPHCSTLVHTHFNRGLSPLCFVGARHTLQGDLFNVLNVYAPEAQQRVTSHFLVFSSHAHLRKLMWQEGLTAGSVVPNMMECHVLASYMYG